MSVHLRAQWRIDRRIALGGRARGHCYGEVLHLPRLYSGLRHIRRAVAPALQVRAPRYRWSRKRIGIKQFSLRDIHRAAMELFTVLPKPAASPRSTVSRRRILYRGRSATLEFIFFLSPRRMSWRFLSESRGAITGFSRERLRECRWEAALPASFSRQCVMPTGLRMDRS